VGTSGGRLKEDEQELQSLKKGPAEESGDPERPAQKGRLLDSSARKKTDPPCSIKETGDRVAQLQGPDQRWRKELKERAREKATLRREKVRLFGKAALNPVKGRVVSASEKRKPRFNTFTLQKASKSKASQGGIRRSTKDGSSIPIGLKVGKILLTPRGGVYLSPATPSFL